MSANKAPRRRRLLAPGINLTPLLDVIFNLVFFFLLATTLRRDELQTEVQLPSSETASRGSGEFESVAVDKDGNTYYRGELVTEEELQDALNRLADSGVSQITIRGDEGLELGRLYEIMDLCHRARLRISLLSRPSAEAGP